MLSDEATTFPVLNTHSLILRQLIPDDAEAIYHIRSDEKVAEYLARPICKSVDEANEFIQKINDSFRKNEALYWAITLKGKNELIGTICLWKISREKMKAEIGFELFPAFQGKGIMKEAIPKVIDFALNELNLKTIEGEVAKENQRSIRLMVKNGFKLSTVYAENENTIMYELVRE
ncbi:MAG: GNAT family N-acetyltransferase [Ignavibacteriaceae bacterium]